VKNAPPEAYADVATIAMTVTILKAEGFQTIIERLTSPLDQGEWGSAVKSYGGATVPVASSYEKI
jgi:hypothetical protein